MTPLVGACERTSDVALTFRWLLALGLRLLLFQLPAPLNLQHWILILGLPVDMTLGRGKEERAGRGKENMRDRDEQWESTENKNREQDVGREVNISRKVESSREGGRHSGERKITEQRDSAKKGREDIAISLD